MTEIAETYVSLDLIWGAESIAKFIGRTTRSTYEMLERGQLPPAKKVNGRWVAERGQLIEFFMSSAA